MNAPNGQFTHKLLTNCDATPSPKLGPRWPSFKNVEVWGLEGTLPTSSTKGGEKGVLKASGLN